MNKRNKTLLNLNLNLSLSLNRSMSRSPSLSLKSPTLVAVRTTCRSRSCRPG